MMKIKSENNKNIISVTDKTEIENIDNQDQKNEENETAFIKQNSDLNDKQNISKKKKKFHKRR